MKNFIKNVYNKYNEFMFYMRSAMKYSFKSYLIKKGNHYCSNWLRISPYFYKTKLSYSVIFTDSCQYDLPYPESLAVNKLFGLSYGFHHENSARFGWHYNYGQIQLFAYCYVNGKRVEVFICALDINKEYKLSILRTNKKYFFAVTGEGVMSQKTILLNNSKLQFSGYKLWPYFGGKNVAPHNIEILMRENNG